MSRSRVIPCSEPLCGPGRAGMTLVEMLVATTATLILMAAIAQVFAVFGSTVSGSRSVLDLDGRLRNVAWRLRSDLTGATARTLPPLSPDSGEGYFELIEGPLTDYQDASNSGAALVTGTTPVGPTVSTTCQPEPLVISTTNVSSTTPWLFEYQRQ